MIRSPVSWLTPGEIVARYGWDVPVVVHYGRYRADAAAITISRGAGRYVVTIDALDGYTLAPRGRTYGPVHLSSRPGDCPAHMEDTVLRIPGVCRPGTTDSYGLSQCCVSEWLAGRGAL